MHVIAGTHKGRRLLAAEGTAVRPTSSRVREALFSILQTVIPGARVLDLYAGTGAVGIEALSRGAGAVVFVESDPASLRLLQTNLQRCGNPEQAQVVRSDVERFLQRADQDPFDVVFADPPYRIDAGAALLPSLSCSAMIRVHTTVIVEHATKLFVPQQIGRLARSKQYRYGDTSLSVFQVSTAGPPA